MKLVFTILLAVLSYCLSYSQDKQSNGLQPTSDVLKTISLFWKNDSLANNGNRFKRYEMVLNSKIDNVTSNYLVENLGQPNIIKNTNHGSEYWHYVYDTTKMSGQSRGFEILYIIFLFDTKTKLLKEIDKNVMP